MPGNLGSLQQKQKQKQNNRVSLLGQNDSFFGERQKKNKQKMV